jgi:LPS-assembly protein
MLGAGVSPSPTNSKSPVTFTADDVQYDRDAGIVTATGHVEAWQDDKTLRADKIVFNRNTGVAAATGHVVLQQADGEVMFSDYAELTQDMKDGVLFGMRALLTQNGKLAANGARRTDAKINEMTRAIYTTCNLCVEDPTRPPKWDIRARRAIQDVEHKKIEYYDAIIDVAGIPVLYTPYLAHPDPSQKRASGLLPPTFGFGSSTLGAYIAIPYYLVIDDSSDVTLTTMLTARAGEAVEAWYRKKFNDGVIKLKGSIAEEHGKPEGHLFFSGDFALNDVFHWGFDINRASNGNYLRDYKIAVGVPVLGSTVYLEGFGQGAYTRTDMRFYQSIENGSTASLQPTILPRTVYSYFSPMDSLGGRTTVDIGAFNLIRGTTSGTSDDRVNMSLGWSRPFRGPIGDLYNLSFNVDSEAYNARGLNLFPNYSTVTNADSAQAMPTASLEMRLPIQRVSTSGWGSQIIEPIAKLMVSPRGSSYRAGNIPNEDSFDTEFTDATLFDRNHNGGLDRLEGGIRLALGTQATWLFPNGAKLQGMIGENFRTQTDPYFSNASGLRGTMSDIVTRQTFSPNGFFDLTTRQRFDHDTLNPTYIDGIASTGPDWLRVNAGYIFSKTTPLNYFNQAPNTTAAITDLNTQRNAIQLGGSTKLGSWKFGANVTRDLHVNEMDTVDARATYEDECLIFDVRYYKRYYSVNGDSGDSGLLFNITLKSVGEFGFNAE